MKVFESTVTERNFSFKDISAGVREEANGRIRVLINTYSDLSLNVTPEQLEDLGILLTEIAQFYGTESGE